METVRSIEMGLRRCIVYGGMNTVRSVEMGLHSREKKTGEAVKKMWGIESGERVRGGMKEGLQLVEKSERMMEEKVVTQKWKR